MKLKLEIDLLNEMQDEYLRLVGNGVLLVKPIKFRNSPHAPEIIITYLSPDKDYRYNRQLLATIIQRLRQ